MILGDEAYKDKDDSFWTNMIKEADKNGDGEVNYKFNRIILDWLSWIHRYDG